MSGDSEANRRCSFMLALTESWFMKLRFQWSIADAVSA
jgi:hypothetical protein